MPHLAQPYDYNALASSLLNKLLPIFGRDAVIQTSYSIKEIQVSENQRIGGSENRIVGESENRKSQSTRIGKDSGQARMTAVIRGDAQVVFDQLVEEFRELSPFVVDRVMGELEDQQLGA